MKIITQSSINDYLQTILLWYVFTHEILIFTENWSDILDQSSYREVSNTYSPEEESIYAPYTNRRNDILTDVDDNKFLTHFINNLPNLEEEDVRNLDRDSPESDMVMDATSYLGKIACEVGAADDCPFNSECIPIGIKLRNGICKCVPGTEEDAQGACVQTLRPFAKGPTIQMDSLKKSGEMIDDSKIESSSPKSVQNLTVSVLPKQVMLSCYILKSN